MSNDPTRPYEHSRRTLPRWGDRSLAVFGPRAFRPLVGAAAGTVGIVAFLAVRGNDWSREEDWQLLIAANVAIGLGIAVAFLAEYLRSWVTAFVLALLAGMFIAISQTGPMSATASDVLLGIGIVTGAAILGVLAFDFRRFRRRSGY